MKYKYKKQNTAHLRNIQWREREENDRDIDRDIDR